jgi:hypothetical protein
MKAVKKNGAQAAFQKTMESDDFLNTAILKSIARVQKDRQGSTSHVGFS